MIKSRYDIFKTDKNGILIIEDMNKFKTSIFKSLNIVNSILKGLNYKIILLVP